MQQVKIFKGLESDTSALEAEINSWIRQSGAKVLSLTGNIAPQSEKQGTKGGLGEGGFPASDVIVIVTYETAD